MASAAPAAPAAAPQAPAGNTPGVTSPASAPASANPGAASSQKKGLKPIPKQRIPGVKTWATPDAPAAPDVVAQPEPAAEPKIKIGGKEFTQDELARAFASLEGRTKANARDAEAWRKYQQEQAARPAQAPVAERVSRETQDRTGTPQPTPAQTEAAQKRWIESQGEPFWNQVKQVHAQHGPEVALAYVMDKFDSSLQERMQSVEKSLLAKLAPALTPILQERVEAQNKNFAQDIWSEFATYTDEASGEPLFPELAQDPRLAQTAGHFWLGLRQKFGHEFAMSEYGLYSAYRDAQAFLASEAQQGKNAGNAAQAVLDAIEHDRKAGSRTAVQAPSAPPVSAPGESPRDEGDAIKKRIREARGGYIKTSTGFNMGVRPLGSS